MLTELDLTLGHSGADENHCHCTACTACSSTTIPTPILPPLILQPSSQDNDYCHYSNDEDGQGEEEYVRAQDLDSESDLHVG